MRNKISNKISLYNVNNIFIGNNVRIDDFCIISAGEGGIYIGDNVHIGAHSFIAGAGRITIENFAGVSVRCNILSSNADYSGKYMTNPTVNEESAPTLSAPVTLEKHSLMGLCSSLLPGSHLKEGAVLGAHSFTQGTTIPAFEIWAGIPAKFIKHRKKDLLELAKRYENDDSKACFGSRRNWRPWA